MTDTVTEPAVDTGCNGGRCDICDADAPLYLIRFVLMICADCVVELARRIECHTV